MEGHEEVIRALLKAGADINALSEDGRTPLFLAAFKGREDCVRTLLNSNADRTISTMEGKTPAEAAATPAIALLLEAPAEKKARSE